MSATFNARNAIFSQRKSEIFQNSILNEPLGCMRPPPDTKPIIELNIICFVHALGGNLMLPHIEIHCKTMCGTRASTWHKAEPGQVRGNRTEGSFSEKKTFWPNVPGKTSQRKRFWPRKNTPDAQKENLWKSPCAETIRFLSRGHFHPRKGKPLRGNPCGPKTPFRVSGKPRNWPNLNCSGKMLWGLKSSWAPWVGPTWPWCCHLRWPLQLA